jgi:hypothetical protein
MDKQSKWNWVPAFMPGVANILADRKREVGPKHVALCWQRGVIERLPGWFFAREGALAIGTPWPDIADIAGWQVVPTQALVVLRPVELADGA